MKQAGGGEIGRPGSASAQCNAHEISVFVRRAADWLGGWQNGVIGANLRIDRRRARCRYSREYTRPRMILFPGVEMQIGIIQRRINITAARQKKRLQPDRPSSNRSLDLHGGGL